MAKIEICENAGKIMGELFDLGLTKLPICAFGPQFLGSNAVRILETSEDSGRDNITGAKLLEDMIRIKLEGEDAICDTGSVEYWCGYVYGYAQKYFDCSFGSLLSAIPFDELYSMHKTLQGEDMSIIMDALRKHLDNAGTV